MTKKLPQFSIRLLLLLVCGFAVLAAFLSRKPPPDPPAAVWRESLVEEFKDSEPLLNVPTITVLESKIDYRKVAIRNGGDTTLTFWQFDGGGTRQFWENYLGDQWSPHSYIKVDSIEYRGADNEKSTPLTIKEIAPNETLEVDVWLGRRRSHRQRILTMFSERDTNRKDLVVLATMPKSSE